MADSVSALQNWISNTFRRLQHFFAGGQQLSPEARVLKMRIEKHDAENEAFINRGHEILRRMALSVDSPNLQEMFNNDADMASFLEERERLENERVAILKEAARLGISIELERIQP